MTTFRNFEAFDLLFKNLFNSDGGFAPLGNVKPGHPVDIFENEKGLHIEVAATGLEKKDIKLEIEKDILRISYAKDESADCCEINDCNYIHRGIAKRSFNLAYKVSSKFDLATASAEMKNGLLKISIPYNEDEDSLKRTISIK